MPPKDKTNYQLVIFDFDGTLCDTGKAITHSLRETFRHYKAALPSDEKVRASSVWGLPWKKPLRPSLQSDLKRKMEKSIHGFTFIVYAVNGFRDGLRTQLEYIHDQQSEVIWRDYVHLQFAEDRSETGKY